MDKYEQIYARMHPPRYGERQRKLSDLWPKDQQDFRKSVDAVLSVENALEMKS